ncbi:MAG: stalk domain-containing protein [Candidatus Pristimantibacillus sp.]
MDTYNPQVMINQQLVQFNGPHQPTITNNRVYVPVDFFEHSSIQANVFEHMNEGEVYSSLGNHKILLSIDTNWDSYFYSVGEDDRDNKMEGSWWNSPPFVQGSKLMVPLRIIAERLGVQVQWNTETQTAMLCKDGYSYTDNFW